MHGTCDGAKVEDGSLVDMSMLYGHARTKLSCSCWAVGIVGYTEVDTYCDLCATSRTNTRSDDSAVDKRQISVVVSFGAVIGLCALMTVAGNFLGPYSGTKLSDAGAEGLKIAISALVGALSAMIGTTRRS